MNMTKKVCTALVAVGPAVAALAEGTTNSGTAYSGSTAETIVQGVSGTMTNFLTGAAPVVASVIIAGLSIWAGIKLVGILKSAFSSGKGR